MPKMQSVPHFGVKNGYSRKGAEVSNGEKQTFLSIAQAKRFMRTGNKGSSPCTYKQSNAAKYVIRRTAAAQKLAAIRAAQRTLTRP